MLRGRCHNADPRRVGQPDADREGVQVVSFGPGADERPRVLDNQWSRPRTPPHRLTSSEVQAIGSAYSSDESGQYQVYVQTVPATGDKRQIRAGERPRWRRDGKELYHLSANGTLMAARVKLGAETLEIGPAERLFDFVSGGWHQPGIPLRAAAAEVSGLGA